MDRLKAGYEKLRKHTEQVGDKMMRQAFNSDGAHLVKEKLGPRRQYSIRGRTVVEDRQISEGGFAFVWKVHDLQSHEAFALKKIICQDKDGLAMASREVGLLERLPVHQNLVRYYGHTMSDSETGRAKEVCLLFELCSGGHLLDLLDRSQGKLSEQRILGVFRDIVTAVALLHSQSPPIQHRDLKVENVLLGADGTFKLCDFGSWSDVCSELATLDRQAIGVLQEQIDRYTTMMYRPPEMVDFFQPFTISEKVDIWMLGCVLFTLMFCRHPFQDESSLAIANARYHLSPVPVYSQKLQDLVHWLLARDPANRPSAAQLLDVLDHFADSGGLPLPNEVIERRDKDRRLYEAPPTAPPRDRGAGREQRPQAPLLPEQPERRPERAERPRQHHQKSKKDREARPRASSCTDGFWAQGAAPAAADLWPTASAAVPEPSRAWATFEAAGWPQGTAAPKAPEPLSASSPGAGPRGSPTEALPAAGGSNPWGAAWNDEPVPSLGSRAPAPSVLAGGRLGTPSARPLAHSGRSTRSGRSNTSHRSGLSSIPSCRSPRHRNAADTGDSPKARSREGEHRPPGQESAAGGRFWSLAAPATDGDWGRADPFAAQWAPAGAPGGDPGSWPGFGSETADATRQPNLASAGVSARGSPIATPAQSPKLAQRVGSDGDRIGSPDLGPEQQLPKAWGDWRSEGASGGAQGIWAVLDGDPGAAAAAAADAGPPATGSRRSSAESGTSGGGSPLLGPWPPSASTSPTSDWLRGSPSKVHGLTSSQESDGMIGASSSPHARTALAMARSEARQVQRGIGC